MPEKKISIIIVTYNSEKDIYDCLSSVFQYNDIGDALEIIVVDNCSSHYEEMRQKIQQLYGDKVIVVSNTQNGGYGQGNNVGIQLASAPIIAIMNPDVRLIMPIFKKAIETLEKKNTIMCGGKQLYSKDRAALSFDTSFLLPPLIRFVVRYWGIKTDHYLYKYMFLQGAFFFIRTEEFKSIGCFDENIFMYGEEFDIHQRLLKKFPKKRFAYLKNYKYLHLAGDRDFSENSYKTYLQSMIYIMQKIGTSPVFFLKNDKAYAILSFRLNNIANLLHHRKHKSSTNHIEHIYNEVLNDYNK